LKCPAINPPLETKQRTWVTSMSETPNVELRGAEQASPAERPA